MVGASVKRKEDPRLIMGEGKFTGDVQLKGMVHMAVLRSPHAHAHALIRRIDTAAALGRPEVLAVMTGDQAKERCQCEFPLAGVKDWMKVKSRWPMAIDIARYVGEPVAAVVANTAEAALDALELIDVEYQVLPPAVDLEQAGQPGSPLVHEDLGTNICVDSTRVVGDPDAAFQAADGVVSLRLTQRRLIPNPMEPRAVVASYEQGTGNLTMWVTSQGPHFERSMIAQVLGFPEHKLRVIAIDVGGGFGCKLDGYSEAVLAPLFSMQLHRPVKWAEDRQEHFLSTIHGRGEVQYVDAAYKNDGTLLALRIKYITDLGAYCVGGSHAVVDILTPSGGQGVYKVRNLSWTSHGIFTNKVPVGPYRGYGQHATSYFLERTMDLIAGKLGLDPITVRRTNFITADALTPSPTRHR
jgi:carbon-monoxide dehydrogenase large subunit